MLSLKLYPAGDSEARPRYVALKKVFNERYRADPDFFARSPGERCNKLANKDAILWKFDL